MEGEVIISYILNRENWSSCCDIDLESGGKMVGSLELITKGETQKIGKKKKRKCKNHVFDNLGNQKWCTLFWLVETDLKPGDVVLATVKFKGMPRLEVEPYMDMLYRDEFDLGMGVPPEEIQPKTKTISPN
jgi:hypothetical protein